MAAAPAERERPRRREERAGSAKRRRREEPPQEPPEESPERPAETPRESPAEPGYLALARGLLAGSAPARCSPAPARPAGEPAGDGAGDGDDLLGQLIRDLVGLRGAGAALGLCRDRPGPGRGSRWGRVPEHGQSSAEAALGARGC